MKKVYIKYNPYKVETEVMLEGKELKVLDLTDKRLQEWIEDFPRILFEECNTLEEEFEITFKGTSLDYEDVEFVVENARREGIETENGKVFPENVRMHVIHEAVQELGDKEKAIEEIFYDIQNGPFQELNDKSLKHSFEMALSEKFPVNVIATMSAGKSTLINALLRKKLMPAKQEACTAIVTEITDKDKDIFEASIFDKNNIRIESNPNLKLEDMERFNSDSSVSRIEINGDIPFVSSDDTSLVLVDTPGPNNSRDAEHQRMTMRNLNETSKTLVLYVLNATQLAVNDDSNLLEMVADSMKVGGKQSKDRYIFVVNKLDNFRKGEDDVESSIEKVKKYLEDKGIKNPNVYPASALTALDIRTILKNHRVVGYSEDELDELDDNVRDVINKVKKMNKNIEFHLEKYAPATPSMRNKLNKQIEEAKELSSSEDKEEKSEGMKREALIHSGIVSIEEAIKLYVEKYSKTAKIKNIYETFHSRLESAKSFENVKQEILSNREKQAEITKAIDEIQNKLKDAEGGKKFLEEVESLNGNEIKESIRPIFENVQQEIQKIIYGQQGQEFRDYQIESKTNEFETKTKNLDNKVQIKLEETVEQKVKNMYDKLVKSYKDKLKSLSEDIKIANIEIDPLDFISGDIDSMNANLIFESIAEEKSVATGRTKTVKNQKKSGFFGWIKFWEPSYVEEEIYEEIRYVKGEEFAKRYFSSPINHFFEISEETEKYIDDTITKIKRNFRKEADKLDSKLNEKLEELKGFASENNNLENIINENNSKLAWLENIQNRVNGILEI
ncbi:hypothetical protein JMUB5056_1154 [Leptotrichia hongkongensis]|uniref:Dynamin N-terminal domain-containing protein n=1 Tax=Leptotrichia hongkongensis TaxID=554406 RepID=A0A510L6E5_9FUSO|nr:dynamin family protein [Leptotrichia hongkongensis]BBM59570.1 hypothetical protein JMUB5056_1154 [Leptotrichia hongkongensis]